jgi:dihydroflavonol-4-reductase
MRVAITGATGVVGGAVARHLLDAGHEVVAVARDPTRLPKDLKPWRGDILDEAGLGQAFAGAEVVFHVAGLNQMCGASSEELHQANVVGTANVARSSASAGVRRLVYTSSASSIGEEEGTIATEDSPHRGYFLSDYERSKFDGELASFSAPPDLEVVAVLPSSVQGPGRSTGSARLIIDLVNGRLPAVVDTRLSLVDIDDCARGHLLAAGRGRPGRRYLLSGVTLPIRQAAAFLERALGRKLRLRVVPGWVASAGAATVEFASRAVGRRPRICRAMARTLRHGHAYDGSRATRELGLDYIDPEVMLGRMVDWYRKEGLIR